MVAIGWLLGAFTAGAAAPVAGTPFEGWVGSRWHVSVEETTPTPLELSAEENVSFRTRALQMEVVFKCGEVRLMGKKRAEVDCKPEAMALRATPRRLEASEATNPGNQKVLDNIVKRLTSGVVRLTVSREGRVTTVDLPELSSDTRRESESREMLRRLMYDVVAGFSLERPEDWATAGGWREKTSALLRAPTEPATLGVSKLEHTVATVDGITVIQTEGSGTFTAPYVPWEYSYEGGFAKSGGTGASSVGRQGGTVTASVANDGVMTGVETGSATPNVDRTFSGTLTSIAVMDEATGMPSERVWAMLGRATASSVGNMQNMSLYYAGKVKRIAGDESVQLGPTEVVAPPGQKLEGIGIWEPIAVF
jgi:hypothetical protein